MLAILPLYAHERFPCLYHWNRLLLMQARQQLSRERVVAGAELKVLHEKLKFCYHKEGVNHLEGCKDLVEAIVAKSKAPYWGMPGAPTREW